MFYTFFLSFILEALKVTLQVRNKISNNTNFTTPIVYYFEGHVLPSRADINKNSHTPQDSKKEHNIEENNSASWLFMFRKNVAFITVQSVNTALLLSNRVQEP